jgi:hypothetical protein
MKRSQKHTAEAAKRRVARVAGNTHPEIPDLDVVLVNAVEAGGELSPKAIFHEGVVKKRGNTAYKQRYFVLKNSFLKYFADKATYMRDPNNFQGSMSKHYMTVAAGTPGGVLYSKDGYHFTVTNTNDGKTIECACEVCVLCVCEGPSHTILFLIHIRVCLLLRTRSLQNFHDMKS